MKTFFKVLCTDGQIYFFDFSRSILLVSCIKKLWTAIYNLFRRNPDFLSSNENTVNSFTTGESLHENERSLQETPVLQGQNSESAPNLTRVDEILKLFEVCLDNVKIVLQIHRFISEHKNPFCHNEIIKTRVPQD